MYNFATYSDKQQKPLLLPATFRQYMLCIKNLILVFDIRNIFAMRLVQKAERVHNSKVVL